MTTIYAGLLSGLIATIISLIVTSISNSKFHKRYEEKSFIETRIKLNEIMLNEPFLRSDTILNEFITGDEKQDKVILRKYDLFCIMLFNYLKSLCDYYGYDIDAKFTGQYNFKANTSCYKKWWNDNRAMNNERYDPKFVEFIDKFLNSKKAIQ